MSYRLRRRHFVQGLGGLFGLRLLLDNLVSVARGAPPPPRLLFVHWPGGTIHYDFLPNGSGRDFVTSPILMPFESAGLREDMVVIYGTNMNVGAGGGGAAEAGTVMMSTGASCPGTRSNGGEADDAVAGGPSFEHVFLNHVPGLQRPGIGSINVACDARVDSLETSSRCLSYSYETRSIDSARPSGPIIEFVPQLPVLSPLAAFSQLFEGFVPGLETEELQETLRLRRSVLDSVRSELDRLAPLVPAAERPKIDVHLDAVRAAEEAVARSLEAPGSQCMPPEVPDASLEAQTGSSFPYANALSPVEVADDVSIERMSDAYFSVIRAAFQCDLIRAATFQWCPSTNKTAFAGLYPLDPEGAYMHHPLGSYLTRREATMTARPDGDEGAIVDFLTGVHTWFNQRLANALVEFKAAEDVFGGSLLDTTVVPFMTEKAEMSDSWSPMPSLVLGGRGLGIQGGQFIDLTNGSGAGQRPHNDVWMSVAQALLQTSDPLPIFEGESFEQTGVAPLPGFWQAP